MDNDQASFFGDAFTAAKDAEVAAWREYKYADAAYVDELARLAKAQERADAARARLEVAATAFNNMAMKLMCGR
jgi:division protein CdvB (Snf7/Vps24/ESCRT-III family)